ncbi:2-C-methyl-D-erythritol 4-phosphate cytidylyltransferase [Aurantivibrio plasticivorans]
MTLNSDRYFAIVPAAGIGSRFQSDIPKQYAKLLGKTVLEHSLEKLLSLSSIEKVLVPIHQDDEYWSTLSVSQHNRVQTVKGGAERSDSVLAGLDALKAYANPNDWVLVHDAARPCVTLSDLNNLMSTLSGTEVGGLLASPINDTLKRSDNNATVVGTVDRRNIWAAQTPQMFRFGLLHKALSASRQNSLPITDESMAIEALGFSPELVKSSSQNIKITVPEDLSRAEVILKKQGVSM